ncbi:hypothetical protein VCHA34P112_230008 [Vibrio chagasii]|nr:hypothetical protein VCHA34P112_230008 [Vibrio chagasii]CAH7108845.1 hypothetical protein VCHA56P515_220008 [Vibrio chagasii]CAH7168358.1 hypothetical protein VCHA53O463_220084 [Vibrio chagasii]
MPNGDMATHYRLFLILMGRSSMSVSMMMGGMTARSKLVA